MVAINFEITIVRLIKLIDRFQVYANAWRRFAYVICAAVAFSAHARIYLHIFA